MVAAIDALGVAVKPGVVDTYASANANPPIVGTVAAPPMATGASADVVHNMPWTRDGTNIGSATSATYTLVSADTAASRSPV